MNPEWLYLFAGATALSAIGFVCVAVLWLRRLRETLSQALTDAAAQQVRTAQHLGDALAQVQKQQDGYARQVHILAQAGLRLQQELTSISHRLNAVREDPARPGPTVH